MIIEWRKVQSPTNSFSSEGVTGLPSCGSVSPIDRTVIQFTALPTAIAIIGRSIAVAVAKEIDCRLMFEMETSRLKIRTLIQIAATATETQKQHAQTSSRRACGKAQITKDISGNTTLSQIKCIETSALVGGNQSPSPQRNSRWGMGTLPS
jgi:hypothetical protein